jgi:hypothetical protein
MAKLTFTISDFSGGTNGYVDPLDIADNELAQCQGFKAEPGVVSVLGDMKGTYTGDSGGSSSANDGETAAAAIDIESGYGLFSFSHDYQADGDLGDTKYMVLMDGVTFDIWADSDTPVWIEGTTSPVFNLGTVASDNSFALSVKPCFFIADGAFRVSPGNFAAKDSEGGMDADFAATPVYGKTEAVNADSDLTDYVTAGDTVIINNQEMVALIVTSSVLTAARNMTGTFPSVTANATDDTVYVVPETRWRGVVKRRNFTDVTLFATFTEWYSTYAHPRPPVTYVSTLDHDAITDHTFFPFLVKYDVGNIAIDAAQAPVLHIGFYQDATNSANADATWDGAIINLYTTALYDEAKQESQPNKYETDITVAATTELGVWVGVEYANTAGLGGYRINKRVTGARLYYEDTTNEPGTLFQLLEIDFERGVKKAEAETFEVWKANDANTTCECPFFDASGATATERTSANKNAFIFTSPPKAFTYEINTLYPPDVNTHARYKTATVINRRAFIGNVYQSGKANGDRMISSPVNKFDILPEYGDFIIDVTQGDGDEIVKLEAYADRILQFKKRTLYIINVGGALGEEFLESQHRNMGVENPSQTCMTEYGVAWVNSHGVFLYDGQNITDLTREKLQITNTVTAERPRALNIIESNIPLIGYHPDNKWLVVHVASDVSSAFEAEAWIHDFKNGSWTKSVEFSTDAEFKTNMVWTPDNNLVLAAEENSSDTPKFLKYRAPAANMTQAKLLFLTKEFNLNAPGVKKKLRSIYITFSASANSYIEADILYKHPTGATITEESLEEANSGSTYYTNALGFKSTSGAVRTVELVPVTYVTNAYTFQLKLHNPDAAYPYGADFKLYNVAFVYRPLGTR